MQLNFSSLALQIVMVVLGFVAMKAQPKHQPLVGTATAIVTALLPSPMEKKKLA